MPELQKKTADQENGPAISASSLKILSTPDGRFAGLTMEAAGRCVIIHYLCDPEDDGSQKRKTWQMVPGMTRIVIAKAALCLNAKSIDWTGFDSLRQMMDAERALPITSVATKTTTQETVN